MEQAIAECTKVLNRLCNRCKLDLPVCGAALRVGIIVLELVASVTKRSGSAANASPLWYERTITYVYSQCRNQFTCKRTSAICISREELQRQRENFQYLFIACKWSIKQKQQQWRRRRRAMSKPLMAPAAAQCARDC